MSLPVLLVVFEVCPKEIPSEQILPHNASLMPIWSDILGIKNQVMFFIYWKVRWNLFSEVFRSLRGHMDTTHKKNKNRLTSYFDYVQLNNLFCMGMDNSKDFQARLSSERTAGSPKRCHSNADAGWLPNEQKFHSYESSSAWLWKQFNCIYTHNGKRRKRSCPAYCFKAYLYRP